MTEKQYVNRVVRLLFLPKELQERVREDLTQDIRAARENGETMEQIVARMGRPGHLAEELMQNYMSEVKPVHKGKKALRVCAVIAMAASIVALLKKGITGLVVRAVTKEAASIGIIGGADGPTSIFVTTAILPAWRVVLHFVIPIVVIIAAILILRKTKK